MSEKAYKATEVFFDTAGHGEVGILGFKMSRAFRRSDIVGENVVTFALDKKQLDWLVYQMAEYVKHEKRSGLLWTPT